MKPVAYRIMVRTKNSTHTWSQLTLCLYKKDALVFLKDPKRNRKRWEYKVTTW